MSPGRHPTLIPHPDELRSARLVIRPYRPDDAAAFAAIDESRALLAPWLPWVHAHRDVDNTRDFCMRAAAGYLLRSNLDLAIFDVRDGAYLGGIGLCPDWQARTFEIGYWLRRSKRASATTRSTPPDNRATRSSSHSAPVGRRIEAIARYGVRFGWQPLSVSDGLIARRRDTQPSSKRSATAARPRAFNSWRVRGTALPPILAKKSAS